MKIFRNIALIILAFFIIIVVPVNAQPVDTVNAKIIAKSFFSDRLSKSKSVNAKSFSTQDIDFSLVRKEDDNLKSSSRTLYYIYNVRDKSNPKNNKGFVIISADKRITPVLGYSFTGEFTQNDQPPAYKEWMNNYRDQITYIIRNDIKPEESTVRRWKTYSNTFESKSANGLAEVLPLVTTTWSQGCFYNNSCPEDSTGSCNRAIAGCTAIAMAQIMKYWNYPAANNPIPGYQSHHYNWISAEDKTNYNWSNMSSSLSSYSSEAEKNAVSKIVYHCGVSVQMDYGPKSSGAASPASTWVKYFKYSPAVQYVFRSNFSDENWISALKKEIDNHRPIYYVGYNDVSGHAFVCDGYQDDNCFHFNWGWGGYMDGYFYINNLGVPSIPFSYTQNALIGISPVTETSNLIAHYPLEASGNDITGKNSAMTLINSPFQKGAVYNNGIYSPDDPSGGSNIITPDLAGFSINSFSISFDFMIPENSGEKPILVAGRSTRWLGLCQYHDEGSQKISLLTNNNSYTLTDYKLTLNRWYNAKIIFDGEIVQLYLNDELICTKETELLALNDYNFSTTNYGNGTVFKGYFKDLRIYRTSPPPLIITSPDGGEQWKSETSHDITWTSSGNSGNVRIQYSVNNGTSWNDVIANTPDDGFYSWTVPYDPSTNCIIRLTDADNDPSDISDAVFTISSEPFIIVTAPDGGETWQAGTSQDILWNSHGTSGTVTIEFSVNNGATWTEIITSSPDEGVYRWSVPDYASANCLIRINDTKIGVADVSNAEFKIDLTTGSIDDIDKSRIIIYPVPAKDFLTIDLGIAARKETKIEIIDLSGILVYKEIIRSEPLARKELNISGLKPGCYLVKITVDNDACIKKLIIE